LEGFREDSVARVLVATDELLSKLFDHGGEDVEEHSRPDGVRLGLVDSNEQSDERFVLLGRACARALEMLEQRGEGRI
jgi:hypothetical protein